MAQFELHSFTPNDFDDFTPQSMQEDEYMLFKKDRPIMLEYIEKEENTVTITRNGKTIGVYGFIPLPEKGVHAWLFFAKGIKKSDMGVAVRMIKAGIAALEDLGYEWVQTPVRTDFPQGERLIKMLGFSDTEVEEDVFENGITYKYWMRVL